MNKGVSTRMEEKLLGNHKKLRRPAGVPVRQRKTGSVMRRNVPGKTIAAHLLFVKSKYDVKLPPSLIRT